MIKQGRALFRRPRNAVRTAALAIHIFLILTQPLQAQGQQTSNPVVLVIVLGALSLAPFVLIMLTSFVKIAVVLSILRNAMGTQNIPPNQVITGFALVLTLFIMIPIAREVYLAAGDVPDTRSIFSEASVRALYDAADRGKEPVRQFLAKHCHEKDTILFMELAVRLNQDQQPPAPQDFQIIIPAFVTSELKEAFQIGFLVFIPFIIIDMVVANILISMGMMMLSPVLISLPFKLLLFVLVDGWFLIVRGLVLTYL